MSSRFLALFVLLSSLSLAVQAQSQGTDRWRDWYADYQANQFVIQVPFDADNARRLKSRLQLYKYRVIYIPAESLSGDGTPVLRIGFFKTAEDAKELLEASDFLFRQQTVLRLSPPEHDAVVSELIGQSTEESAGEYFVFAIDGDSNDPLGETSSKILTQAKNLYVKKNYGQAAEHYQLLALIADTNTALWARELLGLCYEKMGDRQQAMRTYASLLEEFPAAPGKSRVDQRLRALQTAALDVQEPLQKSSYTASARKFFVRGLVGQYYRTLSRATNDDPSEEVLSALSTDFDVRSTAQWSGQSLSTRLNGYWIKDNLVAQNSEFRLKRAYLDYAHERSGWSVKLGRQRDFDSGVFSSFDGLEVEYAIRDNLDVAVVAGSPYYTAEVYEGLDFFFYGANLTWNPGERWRLTSYVNSQTLNDVTDREAVGLRTQYSSSKLSTALSLDYDTAFAELNSLLWNGNYRFNDALNVAATFGHQRSPFLTAANIFIGQPELDLELYLESQDNRDQLLDEALARTSMNDYYSLSINSRLAESVQLIADMYSSNLTEIQSMELLPGETEPTPTDLEFSQMSYGLQLIKQGLFFNNESTTLGARRNDGDSSSSTQVFLRERLRFGSSFSLSPKISYSDITFVDSDATQTQLRYSLALIYKPFRNTELNLEAGNESVDANGGTSKFVSDYIFAGYRINF